MAMDFESGRVPENDPVDVQVFSFFELLDLDYPLALDNYQRPYVWQ